MLYLIMRCDELGDQYECDADRTPITLVENWKDWAKNHTPDYAYEVWQYNNDGTFSCIKDYNDVEEGMALYYWDEDEDPEENRPHIIANFPSTTRKSTIPSIVKQTIKKGAYTWNGKTGVDNDLSNCGHITWYNKEKRYYVYGEYRGNHYIVGY